MGEDWEKGEKAEYEKDKVAWLRNHHQSQLDYESHRAEKARIALDELDLGQPKKAVDLLTQTLPAYTWVRDEQIQKKSGDKPHFKSAKRYHDKMMGFILALSSAGSS
jgi:hypothetical protein